jgi:hypothetical protein
MIRDQLKGKAHFDWRQTGLVCEITMTEVPPVGPD